MARKRRTSNPIAGRTQTRFNPGLEHPRIDSPPRHVGALAMKPLSGVLPVVQVPFLPDFSFDLEALRREVDWLFANGVQGLVVGMVSEVQRLADAERDRLHTSLVAMAAGRGPVVASVGAESLCQALRHAR